MEDGALVCESNLVNGLTHSERLMPLVDGIFQLTGWKPADIDIFAAVNGPGSFTGVRIGVSTVKGMAEAFGKPVVAVDTLEVLAAAFPGYRGIIAPLLDARRAQVYCAVYSNRLEPLFAPTAMALEDFLAQDVFAGNEPVMFCGDGALPYAHILTDKLGERASIAPPHMLLQRAGAAAFLANRSASRGRLMNAAELEPEYLRKSSAEQNREAALEG